MLLKQTNLRLPAPPGRQRSWMLPLLGLIGVTGWLATAASQADKQPMGRPSAEHFVLSATLPARTSLRANASYTPKPSQLGCPYQSPALQFDTLPGPRPRQSDFKIPLGYELPDCSLYLSNVSFETEALHGAGFAMRSIANNGSIAVRDDLRPGTSGFSLAAEKHYRSQCDLQSGGPQPGDGQRIRLVCNATDEHWQLFGNENQRSQLGGVMSRQELKGKRIHLEVRRKDLG